MLQRREKSDIERMIAAYREAKSRQDGLVKEAGEVADRLERLAHGLSTRPEHLIIGLPDQRIEKPGEWDIVPSHPLPTIEQLITLTETFARSARRSRSSARDSFCWAVPSS